MATAIKDPRNIERVMLSHEGDVETELRAEVLTKAFKLFKYGADSFASHGPLAKTLHQLNIAPFRRELVDDYKQSKEREWSTHRAMWGHIAATTIIPCLMLAVCWVVKWQFGLHTDDVSFGFLCAGCGATALIGVVAGNTYAYDIKDFKCRMGWLRWSLGKDEELRAYRHYVPVHLLNLACLIREALPDCRIVVEELTEKRVEIVRPLPDPFLVVQLGSEHYTIGVWDEREFEAKA